MAGSVKRGRVPFEELAGLSFCLHAPKPDGKVAQ